MVVVVVVHIIIVQLDMLLLLALVSEMNGMLLTVLVVAVREVLVGAEKIGQVERVPYMAAVVEVVAVVKLVLFLATELMELLLSPIQQEEEGAQLHHLFLRVYRPVFHRHFHLLNHPAPHFHPALLQVSAPV